MIEYQQPITEADRDELRWQDQERRRMAADDALCGFTPDSSGAGENQAGGVDAAIENGAEDKD